MKTNRKAKIRIGIILYVILFAALYLCIYVVPKVSDIFVETYVAEYGTLEIGEKSEALFVRTERLYTADNGGKVERVASGGSLSADRAMIREKEASSAISTMVWRAF